MHFLLLLACAGEPPSLLRVEPDAARAGEPVTVIGDHFGEGAVVRLGGADLEDAVRKGAERIEGVVPASASLGAVDVVVRAADGRASTLRNAFEVLPQVEPKPCGDAVRIVSHIPPTADVVKIDRHTGSGDDASIQQVRIPTADVVRVEYEATTMEGGGICTAIYLRTRDDRRALFDSDRKLDLRQQAQDIGNGLHKPVEVTRDERGDGKPPGG